MYKCEFCGVIAEKDKFMAPSRRYSALHHHLHRPAIHHNHHYIMAYSHTQILQSNVLQALQCRETLLSLWPERGGNCPVHSRRAAQPKQEQPTIKARGCQTGRGNPLIVITVNVYWMVFFEVKDIVIKACKGLCSRQVLS